MVSLPRGEGWLKVGGVKYSAGGLVDVELRLPPCHLIISRTSKHNIPVIIAQIDGIAKAYKQRRTTMATIVNEQQLGRVVQGVVNIYSILGVVLGWASMGFLWWLCS